MWKKLFGRGGDEPESPDVGQEVQSAPEPVKTEPKVTEPAREGDTMSDNMITSDNLSVEMLKGIFEDAYIETSIDDDGDILVKEACKVFVRPDMERKNRIRFFTIFGFNDSASQMDRLDCVNKINNEYIMVTACATDNGGLIFRYDMSIEGGLPKKSLVLALKRFASVPHDAAADHGQGLVD